MTAKQRLATMYHEAGHAVMATHMQLKFKYVTVEPNEQDGSLGHFAPQSPRWLVQDGKYQNTRTDERIMGYVERRIMTIYAGREAEHLFTGRFNNIGAREDEANAMEIARRHVTRDADELKALLKWLRIRTQQHVQDLCFQAKVAAVARELAKRSRLTEAEVWQTIQKAW